MHKQHAKFTDSLKHGQHNLNNLEEKLLFEIPKRDLSLEILYFMSNLY